MRKKDLPKILRDTLYINPHGGYLWHIYFGGICGSVRHGGVSIAPAGTDSGCVLGFEDVEALAGFFTAAHAEMLRRAEKRLCPRPTEKPGSDET